MRSGRFWSKSHDFDLGQNPTILIKIPQSHNHKNSHNSGLQEDGEHPRRGEGVWSDFRGQGVKKQGQGLGRKTGKSDPPPFLQPYNSVSDSATVVLQNTGVDPWVPGSFPRSRSLTWRNDLIRTDSPPSLALRIGGIPPLVSD